MTKQSESSENGKVGKAKGVTRVVVHNAKHLAGKAKNKLSGGK